tara:strand:+ start:188 stop:529 length:342 start_codon:yes stop_codon:yes gene_type:complete
MKKLLILPLILCGSVHAEPYINLEMNRIYPKGSYVTTQYEAQIGYRKVNEKSSWYTTIGPVYTDTAFTESLETELGGFVGGNIEINEDITLYGEIFGSTDETVIVKTGTILSF